MYNEPLHSLPRQAPDCASEPSTLQEPSFRTILLVDDDSDIRSLTRTFLEHEGYRVHSCGNPARADQIFRSSLGSSVAIDLLITDVYMPDRSGVELAQELKALRQELPVLLISGGFTEIEQMEKLRAEGWNFLSKPFALPELLAAVHLILRNGEATA